MDLQRLIIDQFLRLYKSPSLRQASKITGIKLSRYHRILKGSEMKISEFIAIKKVIAKKVGMSENFESLSFECMERLSAQDLFDLEIQMKTKLRKNYYQREV